MGETLGGETELWMRRNVGLPVSQSVSQGEGRGDSAELRAVIEHRRARPHLHPAAAAFDWQLYMKGHMGC